MEAYGKGAVNLRSPYTIYMGDLPVHCAAGKFLEIDLVCQCADFGSREVECANDTAFCADKVTQLHVISLLRLSKSHESECSCSIERRGVRSIGALR